MTKLAWIDRNLGTVGGYLLTVGAIAAQTSGVLPGNDGAHLAECAFVATQLGRALVHAAQALAKLIDARKGGK